jgi:tripartite ATP-independent transporter DctP family solute receptor
MTSQDFITGRRRLLKAAGSVTALAALRSVPARAQAATKKLIIAYTSPPPDVVGIGLDWFATAITERSHGELKGQLEAGTILTREADITNAVKAGNVAIGTPIGAAATLFPEMGVFLVPYLISSYPQAYAILDGKVGDTLTKIFEEKYAVKVLFYYDLGFRHFWNSRRPIREPADLRGMKIRAQPAKIFADTINALGAVAVPMPFAEVVTAAQQGVIDGGDYPVANMVPNKFYEFSKYYSLTYHNYGASVMLMNQGVWNGLRPDQQTLVMDTAREAQKMIRHLMDSVDNPAGAKALLEPHGMQVNEANLPAFKKLAQERLWPGYQKQYAELWEKIVATQG